MTTNEQPAARVDPPKFKVVKGKRRTPRERKYFEKRKKMVEQVIPSVREIGSIEWDAFIMKLSGLPDVDVDKLNPCKCPRLINS